LILSVALGGALALKQKHAIRHELTAEIMLQKAAAVGGVLAAQSAPRRSGPVDAGAPGISATYIADALAQADAIPAAQDFFTRAALERLRAQPGQPHHQFEEDASSATVRYAMRDAHGGVYLIAVPFEREKQALDKYLGQSFLANGLAGIAYI